jgi:hypothetical protein
MNEFKESILKPITIYLSSKGRTGGNSHDPVFNLNNVNNLENVKYALVNSVEIPNVFPNIKTGVNNTISFSDLANAETISTTLSQGFYTLDQLTAKLKTDLDAASTHGITWTITVESKTAKITMQSSSATQLNFAQSNMAATLGFTAATANSTSITSDKGVNLIPTTCVYITSSTFGNISYSWRGLTNIVCKIPINQYYGGVISYSSSDIKKDLIPLEHPNMNEFQFKLYGDDFSPLDLNGFDWSISVTAFK